jgi:hypothetical protein
MRKIINTLMAGVMLSGISVAFTGCTDDTATKQDNKITAPGGTATPKRDINVDKPGPASPLAPPDKKP